MASNMFIKFVGAAATIEGDSMDATHAKEIEVLGWSHGFSQPTSPTRLGAGAGTTERANHQDFSFSKYMDTATVSLYKTLWLGDMVATVTMSCYRADQSAVKYLEVIMEKVIISSISISGGPGDIPVESVSLNYGKVTYKYLPQTMADNTPASASESYHDLVTNTVG